MLLAGRYETVRTLGKGGMAEVYLVRDTLSDGAELALKTQILTDESARLVGALKHEFRVLSRLNHPNVARVFDFGTLEEAGKSRRFFFTSEYVSGQPLREATEGIAFEALYEITAQLFRALSYVHAHGIVHRDIKPANILVRQDGVLKLVDFGVVSQVKVVVAGHTLVGTPAYSAPELIRGDGPTPPADLYAAGISLFEVVTRQLPFQATALREMLNDHLTQPPPDAHVLRADVPRPFSQFIARLLAKEPSARFATAGRALAALSNVAGKTFALDTEETHVGYIASGRLVGREQEIERLRRYTTARLAGKGGVAPGLAVVAPFGLGKSRLLRELRVAQQLAEVPVFVAEVGPTADPVQPWVTLVRQVAGASEPELRDRFGAELTALEAQQPGSRAQPLAFTGAFLAEAAEGRPFVLIVDDLDRADAAVLEILESFLELLSRSATRHRLALVLGVEASPSAAADRLVDWAARGLLERIDLSELSGSQTATLAASMLGTDTLPAEAAERLHEAAQGNPFVLEELLKTLVRDGKVERLASGRVNVAEFRKPKVSAGLVDALHARTEDLTDDARRVLEALAVLNRPTDATALAALGVSDDEKTGEALSELSRAGLVARGLDGRLTLRPPVLAQVVDEVLDEAEGARLHARAGEFIESVDASEAVAAELARHFGRAGDRERESRYSRAAGFRLKHLYANEDALRFLTRAAELEPESPDGTRLTVAIAEIHDLLGSHDDAQAWLDRFSGNAETSPAITARAHLLRAALAAATGNVAAAREAHDLATAVAPERSATGMRVLAARAKFLFEQGETEEALQLATDALAAVPGKPAGSSAAAVPAEMVQEVAELEHVLALAHLAHSGPGVAEKHIATARDLFTRAGDRRGEVQAAHAMGRIEYQRGRIAEARRLFESAAEGYLAVADLQGRANVQMNLGVILHASSDYAGAIAAYHDALEILEAGGSSREQALVGCNLGNLYCLLGSLELARQTTERSLGLAHEAGLKQVEGYDRLILGAVARSEGRLDVAEEHLTAAREILEAAGRRPDSCVAAAKLADIYRQTGRFELATGLLAEAEGVARELGSPAALARCLTSRGRLEVERPEGDPHAAQELLAEARTLADKEGDTELQGEIQHGLALVSERQGDVDQAVATLQELMRQRRAVQATLPPEYAARFFDDYERRAVLTELRRLADDLIETPSADRPPRFRELPTTSTPIPTGHDTPTMNLDLTPTSAIWTSAAVKKLLEIVGDLNTEHDVEALLIKILDSAISLTGAERGFLIEIEADQFEIRVARNLDAISLPLDRFPVSRTIAEEVARTGEPIISHDAVHDAQLRAGVSIQALGTQSILAVPLRSKGRCVGAVWLEHRFEVGKFGERERELSQTLADAAGTALENARLLVLARERADELEAARKTVAELNEQLKMQVAEQEEELASVKELLTHSATEFVSRFDYSNIIGRSPALRRVLKVLDRVTDTDVNVLIEGESGTGKELVARALHANGPRSKKSFVGENCGAVPETLLESTLFGHVRGAFTGAVNDRKGLFELAHQGTLFLDEVGEMPAQMQVKLLRALQESEVRRVGATASVQVDTRVIAATNRDLAEEVKAGRFREDLFYRLNVVRIQLPPLRDRREDIPLLVEHLLAKLADEMGRGGPTQVTKAAMNHLLRHPWPGNVRELENTLKKAFVMAEGSVIAPEDLEDLTVATAGARPRPIPDDERERMMAALEEADGNVAQAAAAIGMPVRTFYYKLSKMGMARRGPRRS